MVDVISPRSVYLQTTNHEFHRINYNDVGIGTYKHLGTIPLGSFITRVMAFVDTPFNAGTTNVFTLGTTPTNANELLAAGTVVPGTVGFTDGTLGRGDQLTQAVGPMEVVGGITYDTVEGGIGLYAKYTYTGTAPTAGSMLVVVEFINPTNT